MLILFVSPDWCVWLMLSPKLNLCGTEADLVLTFTAQASAAVIAICFHEKTSLCSVESNNIAIKKSYQYDFYLKKSYKKGTLRCPYVTPPKWATKTLTSSVTKWHFLLT